jgi:hypothetical protein
MRQLVLFAAVASSLLLAACGHGDKSGAGSNAPQTTPSVNPAGSGSAAPAGSGAGDGSGAGSAAAAGDGSGAGSQAAAEPAKPPAPPEPPPPPGHDFTPTGKLLFAVGACGGGTVPPEYPELLVEKHCDVVKKAQTDYQDQWVKVARAFFAEKVPANVPKKVVYPFAGGDLSTALTVFPDADEITTLSLEPAGDPRTLEALAATTTDKGEGKAAKPAKAKKDAKPDEEGGKKKIKVNPLLERALGTIEFELKFLYRVNFSNTANMITAMRQGELPTQLVFGLSALKVHGYELVSLRYFKIDESGAIQYLTDEEVAKAPDPLNRRATARNDLFSNAELRFRKPGGRVQIYRHIKRDLSDGELKKDPRVVKHLESKGPISGMTKAASYLLSWDSFQTMRNYLIKNVVWMVSDATGVAPKWGKPAGFEYETYGTFTTAHLKEGSVISPDWRKEWNAQPKRELSFRFGYYDKATNNHLVIMKKKSP